MFLFYFILLCLKTGRVTRLIKCQDLSSLNYDPPSKLLAAQTELQHLSEIGAVQAVPCIAERRPRSEDDS